MPAPKRWPGCSTCAPCSTAAPTASATASAIKTGLVRALVHDPPNTVLDQSPSGPDLLATRALRDRLRPLRSRKGGAKCIVLSIHIVQEVERLCDRVDELDPIFLAAWAEDCEAPAYARVLVSGNSRSRRSAHGNAPIGLTRTHRPAVARGSPSGDALGRAAYNVRLLKNEAERCCSRGSST